MSQPKIINKAVVERWPIGDGVRKQIVDQLLTILAIGEPKDQVSAAKLLQSMDKVNADREGVLANISLDDLKAELIQRYAAGNLEAADGEKQD